MWLAIREYGRDPAPLMSTLGYAGVCVCVLGRTARSKTNKNGANSKKTTRNVHLNADRPNSKMRATT
eukprot:6191319-Alexandrium_andersonii.AAC.1